MPHLFPLLKRGLEKHTGAGFGFTVATQVNPIAFSTIILDTEHSLYPEKILNGFTGIPAIGWDQ